MPSEGHARFVSYEKSRTLIYVSKKLADDTSFPLKPGEELWARIEGKRPVVEKRGTKAKK